MKKERRKIIFARKRVREDLTSMCYDDASARYEYIVLVIMHEKKGVPQYIDNRQIYGYISFAENAEEFNQASFFKSIAISLSDDSDALFS